MYLRIRVLAVGPVTVRPVGRLTPGRGAPLTEIMKSHQSHDVLLMCVGCHQESNILDLKMRQRLADECHAPIGTEADVKVPQGRAGVSGVSR